MKHGSRRSQRTGSALLLLGGVVGCDAARPAPAAKSERPVDSVAVQPVAAPASRPNETPAPLAPVAEPEPEGPPVLSADELRDGGRLAPLHVDDTPQRLPPVDAPGKAPGIHWQQKPIAYPRTATP